jgi:ribosome recycling factor
MAYFDLKTYEVRMNGSLTALRTELSGLRTGRASPHLLDGVSVEAHGATAPLKAVAAVSAPEPRLLVVQVWDRAMVKAVEKGIRDAGLGLNPQTDGQTIRLPLPPLTEERRRDLVTTAHRLAEAHRVSVRQIRQDANNTLKRLKKAGEIADHVANSLTRKVQDLTDGMIAQIDATVARKEAEILAV